MSAIESPRPRKRRSVHGSFLAATTFGVRRSNAYQWIVFDAEHHEHGLLLLVETVAGGFRWFVASLLGRGHGSRTGHATAEIGEFLRHERTCALQIHSRPVASVCMALPLIALVYLMCVRHAVLAGVSVDQVFTLFAGFRLGFALPEIGIGAENGNVTFVFDRQLTGLLRVPVVDEENAGQAGLPQRLMRVAEEKHVDRRLEIGDAPDAVRGTVARLFDVRFASEHGHGAPFGRHGRRMFVDLAETNEFRQGEFRFDFAGREIQRADANVRGRIEVDRRRDGRL